MTVADLLEQINHQPETVQFNDVMDTIAEHYVYQPVRFSNGTGSRQVINEAGSNEGSCKLFAFAMLHGLDEQQTLNCFGLFYRKDVIGNPSGDDHANIRRFMQSGWQGIQFSSSPLTPKD